MEKEFRQADKMKSLGTLAGGIAHDFNNILSIILGNAEMVMYDLQESSFAQESLNEVRNASLRARDLVTQILFFPGSKSSSAALTSRPVNFIWLIPQEVLSKIVRVLRTWRISIHLRECIAVFPDKFKRFCMALCGAGVYSSSSTRYSE